MKSNKNWKFFASLFLLSQNISLFGSSIVGYAVIWHITLETSSGLWMMLATIFSNLPQIIISLWGGALADRFNRKHMIMLADGFIALATLSLAISYGIGFQHKILLLIVLATRSAGAGIQSPAVNAIYPQIVPRENLTKIQGINQTINSICLLLAPAVGGILLGSIGLIWAFMVDVVTAIIAITIMSRIKVKQQNMIATTTSMISDIRAGIGYVAKHTELKTLIIFYTVAFVLLTPAMVLSPLMIERTFGSEVWRLTANEIIWTIGSLVGGVFIAFRKEVKNKVFAIAVCFACFGITFGFMSISTNFVMYLMFVLLAGFFMPILTTTQTVYIQGITEPNVLGRVFSIIQIASTSALPIAILFLGPLADIISIQSMLFVSGILLIVCGALYGKLRK
jgi:DHA3 family macrolide efflux protein-like MFS transporter